MLANNNYLKTQLGLTLIEVLIALSIIGVALTAVIKATTQNIRATQYLQNKTVAAWVGQEIVNEARSQVIKLPMAPDQMKASTDMLGKDWYWQANLVETPNQHITKIAVAVFDHANADEEATPLARFESYVYHN